MGLDRREEESREKPPGVYIPIGSLIVWLWNAAVSAARRLKHGS